MKIDIKNPFILDNLWRDTFTTFVAMKEQRMNGSNRTIVYRIYMLYQEI